MADNTEKPGDSASKGSGDVPIVIKKYANRRLYNTTTGDFVTLQDLRQLVQDGQEFTVIDVKTEQDITSSVLAQIIADQEASGERLLPDDLLRQIIGFYEKGMSAGFSDYLQKSMEAYSENWANMETFGEAGRKNMELFQQSLATMFGTGGAPQKPTQKTAPEKPAAPAEPTADPIADQVNALQEQLRAMQEKLDRLSKDNES